MDRLERAEVLLAQLEILLSGGRLEAAAKLAGEVRSQLRVESVAGLELEVLDEEDRAEILGPLSDLLRTQKALGRDIQSEALRRRDQDEDGTAISRTRVSASVKQLGSRLTGYARSRMDQPSLALEAATLLRDLTVSVDGLDLESARRSITALRELITRPRPLGPLAGAQAGGSHSTSPAALIFLLDSLESEVAPDTDLAVLAGLVRRQRALVEQLQPLIERAGEGDKNEVHEAVRRATSSMDLTTTSLTSDSLLQADAHARGAAVALTDTLRQVDAALTTNTLKAVAPPGFLRNFDGGQLPEWELPPALGLHLHERIQRAGAEGQLRTELMSLVRRLMEPSPRDVKVTTNRMGGEDPRNQRIDVDVFQPIRGGRGTRYRVRLSFSSDGGGLQPARWGASGSVGTFGGSADVLFTTDLAECEVTVLRLRDQGPGPSPGYVDLDVDPSFRSMLSKRLPTEYRIGATGQSPIQAEVLNFLQSLLQTAEDSPLTEPQLKALGVPWYDVADLVDRLRPTQERLQYQLLDPHTEDGFLGLTWAGELGHAVCLITHGGDGRGPIVALRRSLLDWLAWAARTGFAGEQASPKDLLVAFQLNVGLKLTFHDALVSDVSRAAVAAAARSLEGAWLASRGLARTALRDLITRMEASYRADVEAQSASDHTRRWQRVAENLLDARAGEQLLRGSKLPASVLFSSLRGVLAHDLRRQGLVAAARATDALGALDDAAVVFGNLVVEPESGHGVLIVGDSKLGKSSITARLVSGDNQNEGWRFGASDRVLLMLPHPGLTSEVRPAMGIASPAHMAFGNFTQEHWYRDEHGREVRPKNHTPSRDLVPIKLVVFMRRDGADLRVSTLRPETIGDLVRDFQGRFGFPASRRFWRGLFKGSAVLDVPLSYRGPDSFLEAAASIRRQLAGAAALEGAASPRGTVLVEDGVWYELADERTSIRISRVDRDGIDVDWTLNPDGSATVRPQHLRQSYEVSRPGVGDPARLGSRLPLDRGRLEQVSGQPMYRVVATRWMPLTPPYFSVEAGQPFFLIPDFPPGVLNALDELLERTDPGRFDVWTRSH